MTALRRVRRATLRILIDGRGLPRWTRLQRGLALVTLAAACWATLGVLARLAFAYGVEPQSVILWRTILAGGIGAAALAFSGQLRWRELRRAARYAVPIGLAVAMNHSTYFQAVAELGAAVAVAVFYVYPALAVVVAWVLLKERCSLAKLFATGLAVVGCAAVSGVGGHEAAVSADGVVWALVSAGSYVAYVFGAKRAVRVVNPLVFLVGTLVAAVPWLLLAARLAGETLLPPPGGPAWIPIALLAILPTLLGYWLFARALRLLDASTAAIASSVEPVLAVLLALAVLGESATALQFAGMVAVFAATLLLRIAAARSSASG